MRTLAILPLLLAACGLTRYREDQDRLFRELRETGIGPYYGDIDRGLPVGPAPSELESLVTREGLGRDEAVAYALARNPELASALAHWEMLLQRVPQVSSFDDPMIQYIDYLRSVETRAGPMDRAVMLSQRIPWPGKLTLSGEMALEEARRSEQAYRARILRVVEQVEHAYAEFALVRRLIEINEDLKRIMKSFETVARKKLEGGRATQPDVLRAQIQYVHLEHHGIVLERDRRIAAERLNAVLNRPPRSALGLPEALPAPAFDVSLEKLLEAAIAGSPELKRAEHALSKAAAQKSLAALAFVPDLTVGASYTQIEGGTNPMFGDDGEDAVALVFGINLPVQAERRLAMAAEAEASIRMARAEYLRVRREIARETSVAYERLAELRHEALLLNDTLLPQTRQHLGAAQKAYETGDLDFLSLLDAEKNIEGIRRDYARVAAEFQKALATLRRAVGGTLP